ncbi:chemotaxis protein CheW [Candidatus Albibeggiatoa sp. nov. NOAA]|uniref:chemotaxis protein CheW n=1 Tax=Candidatus Albibeggiatoa sp. nov. NOAA TaxID=3162724 RepID=UPI0032F81D4B|nr:chemotaxis protein CheW [Thiotrichaceae bacterium]
MAEQEATRAWLLDFGQGLRAAVGAHEMSHVLMEADIFNIPRCPTYCNEVIVWENEILPVLDVGALLTGRRIERENDLLGVAVYQLTDIYITYVAMHLVDLPQSIYVEDDSACPLSDYQDIWKPFAISCFEHEETPVPVIDLRFLFSGNAAMPTDILTK